MTNKFENLINLEKKAKEILDNLVEEGKSFKDIEDILMFINLHMKDLIPSKKNIS